MGLVHTELRGSSARLAHGLVAVVNSINVHRLLSVSFDGIYTINDFSADDFMAPELVINCSTLIMVVTVILRRLATGHAPFRARTVLQHVKALHKLSFILALALRCGRTQ